MTFQSHRTKRSLNRHILFCWSFGISWGVSSFFLDPSWAKYPKHPEAKLWGKQVVDVVAWFKILTFLNHTNVVFAVSPNLCQVTVMFLKTLLGRMRSDEFCFHLRTCYCNCLDWIIEGCFLCTDDFVGSMKWCYKWPLCTIDDTSVWIFSILGPRGQIQEPGDIPVFKPMKPNTSLAIAQKLRNQTTENKHALIVFSIPNIILEFSHLGHTQPIIIIYHIYIIYTNTITIFQPKYPLTIEINSLQE